MIRFQKPIIALALIFLFFWLVASVLGLLTIVFGYPATYEKWAELALYLVLIMAFSPVIPISKHLYQSVKNSPESLLYDENGFLYSEQFSEGYFENYLLVVIVVTISLNIVFSSILVKALWLFLFSNVCLYLADKNERE